MLSLCSRVFRTGSCAVKAPRPAAARQLCIPSWASLLPQIDKDVIETAGYAKRGAGSWDSRARGKSPVVLVIDMQELSFGPDADILTAIREHRPTAMGEVAYRALPKVKQIVDTARELNIPVLHTRVIPHGLTADHPHTNIVKDLTPLENEPVITKSFASAFSGTAMLRQLIQLRADQVIIVGNSTSGCVRATAVDAQQAGFAVCVPYDAVFDRIEVPSQCVRCVC